MMTNELPVSTYIDKTKIYPYSLNLEASPSSLLLHFNQSINRFDDADTKIIVSSDIPSEESTEFQYQLLLDKNESACRLIVANKDVVLDDVMQVFIDGNLIEEGDVSNAKPIDQENSDGYRFGESTLTLRSETIEEEGMECGGKVIIVAELAV